MWTVVVGFVVSLLLWHELRDYLYGDAAYSFSVDRGISHELQLNVDITVATPCHCKASLAGFPRTPFPPVDPRVAAQT